MERRHDILRGYPNVATRTQKKKKKKLTQARKRTNKERNETIVLVIYLGGMYKIYVPDNGQQYSQSRHTACPGLLHNSSWPSISVSSYFFLQ